MERRTVVSRELRHWREERERRCSRTAIALMLLIWVVGLLAVWSIPS